ncbi:GrlR family regulatory protein [Providencia manganoxydans]|uniref:GrlR family regulatory protein n=1 Tax=Providencia manganoxydans TaxID=2923283 RepID=UPI0034E50B68
MKNGIYFVTFNSNLFEYGEATIVINNGIVNGGNYVCFYHGRVTGNILTLDVKRYCPQTKHVFGRDEKYRLLFIIKETPDGYALLGEMLENPENKMEANARFIGDILV